jgi:chaperonin GroEL (HSP60 family)
MIELPDRDEDVGAMFVRGMLWRLHEQAGDGTTTAALLFQAIYAGGLCYIAAGGDPMALRQQLDRGLDLLLGELEAMTRPIARQPQLTQLAESLCDDAPLAALCVRITPRAWGRRRDPRHAGRGVRITPTCVGPATF